MAQPPAVTRRDPAALQNDITRSIEYRREYYKYAIGIASALLAFTVSFPPDLAGPPHKPEAIVWAWSGLGLAIVAGVLAHLLWAHFFITYRDLDNRGSVTKGKARRKVITAVRRVLDAGLIVALAFGVAGVVVFAKANLDNIKTGDDASATKVAGAGR